MDSQRVPCYARQHAGAMVTEFVHDDIIGGDDEYKPRFFTNEALSYVVEFSHNEHRSKFYGSGWKQLVEEYAMREGDVMALDLSSNGLYYHVIPSRNGIPLKPLLMTALNRLTDRQVRWVNPCVYTRGIVLDYSQMVEMINRAFGRPQFHLCIFVHRLTATNVDQGELII